jgi:hypothetical protein
MIRDEIVDAAGSSETIVLPQHYTASQLRLHPEDVGSIDLRNVGILPQYYIASQLRLHPEGGGSEVLRNVDILP